MDSARRASFAANANEGPKCRTGRNVPAVVPKVQASAANGGSSSKGRLTPDLLTLSMSESKVNGHTCIVRWTRGRFLYLSSKRDVNAAKAFLRKAMKSQRIPLTITLDAYAASHRAVADLKESGELPKRVRVRTSKYLNNLIEQDHRRIKQRLRPMLGLKTFRTATVVIAGIELAEKIKKGQFQIGKLGGSTATMPEIWQAALAA